MFTLHCEAWWRSHPYTVGHCPDTQLQSRSLISSSKSERAENPSRHGGQVPCSLYTVRHSGVVTPALWDTVQTPSLFFLLAKVKGTQLLYCFPHHWSYYDIGDQQEMVICCLCHSLVTMKDIMLAHLFSSRLRSCDQYGREM